MIKLSTRDTTVDDISYVSFNMRKSDIAEVKASSNRKPMDALVRGLHLSAICKSIVVNEIPIAIYGVVETGEDSAAVWMLGTNDILKYARPWLRQSKEAMDDINKKYPLLYSFVDVRNDLHIKWLKWVGYKFIVKHDNYGYEQRLFYEIVRI